MSLLLDARPNGIPPRLPKGRNPAIPTWVIDIVDGQSRLLPPGGTGATFWVMQNSTGMVTSVCTYPVDSSLLASTANCVDEPSYLIGGYVRFAYGGTPDAAAPSGKQTALGMLALGAGIEYGDGECWVEPVQSSAPTYTKYICRVPLGADGTWAGTTKLGPPLDLSLYDTCRYLNDGIGNAAHPQVYVHLDRPLGNQNFLVVDEGVACPTGTLPHQPPVL